MLTTSGESRRCRNKSRRRQAWPRAEGYIPRGAGRAGRAGRRGGAGLLAAPCGRAGPVRLPAQRAPASDRAEHPGLCARPHRRYLGANFAVSLQRVELRLGLRVGALPPTVLGQHRGGGAGANLFAHSQSIVAAQGSGIVEAEGWRGRRDVEGMVIAESASGAAVRGPAPYSPQRQAV